MTRWECLLIWIFLKHLLCIDKKNILGILVHVEDDLSSLEPEDDGEGLLEGVLPGYLFLALPLYLLRQLLLPRPPPLSLPRELPEDHGALLLLVR